MRFAIIAAVAIAVVAAQSPFTPPPDHCAQYPSCEACVVNPLCGWCSEDVIYPGPVPGTNITGKQCAGFNPNGKDPFQCNGIYSTEQCVSGYVCNQQTYQCEKGKPGSGNTLAKCEANCSSEGKVFKCNTTTKQCYHVADGTPGSTSLAVCEASCSHPTAHPSSPNPSPPKPHLYACNYTTGTCDAAKPGKGESKAVCELNCKKDNGTKYFCNEFSHKCEKAPPGISGESLAVCEKACNPQPQPNPPANFPKGLYRGVQIQNNYRTGEFDLDVNETSVIFVSMVNGGKPVTITGKPFHLPSTGTDLKLVIKVTSGPNAGKFIKTFAVIEGAPGPETKFMTMAMGAPGGAAPTAIRDAMTQAGQSVYAFDKCNDQNCKFALPAAQQELDMTKLNDRCTQYKENCSFCLSHPYCGWCSTDVIYKDGTKGTQCAGFNSPTHNDSAPFVCNGRYSTLDCDVGYQCDEKTYQCKLAPPGDGVTKAQCETLCRPTPPPTPPEAQYVCNTTLKQCFKCNETHCPGSLPKGPCEAACIHPKHGPPSALVGVWRGIKIENGYENGEVDLEVTKQNITVFWKGKYQYIANVTSLGSDLMILKILDGDHRGFKYGVQYQTSARANGLYSQITWAAGKFGEQAPQSFDIAMYTPGMEEWTLAKCTGAPCKFKKPSA